MSSNGLPDEKRPKIATEEKSDMPTMPSHHSQEEDTTFHLNLEEIDNCQSQIDSLNEKAAEEILAVEVRYNELRKPHYIKRGEYIAKIPDFWPTVFLNHPQLSSMIPEMEQRCLHHLKEFTIEEAQDIKEGYKIILKFESNPYFENELLIKEYHAGSDGMVPSTVVTPIKWKPGKCFLPDGHTDKESRKRKAPDSFFSWFTDSKYTSADEMADWLKDEIWVNPLQYFMMPEVEETDEETPSDEDNVEDSEDKEDEDEDD